MTEERGGYGQFCPVSMAAEVFCTRWTALVVRELMSGSTRFSDLRRGLPKISPTLLSKRLKELEAAGVITAQFRPDGNADYRLTAMGEELRPIVFSLGVWGHRWIESRLSLRNLDPSLLMWDIRRTLDPRALPARRCTVQFLYPELPEHSRSYWLVAEDGTIDLCNFDPGHPVDVLVTASLYTMTAVWMGHARLKEELARGALRLDGEPDLVRILRERLAGSAFAPVDRRVA